MNPLPQRAGDITVATLVHLYMSHYAGRDSSRGQRLRWWSAQLGAIALQDLHDDQVAAQLESLRGRRGRYYAGKDADGRPIMRAKDLTVSPATVNRYAASLAAVITWAIRRRIAPRGYVHPCRSIERDAEHNERTRFLSDEERTRLLQACRDRGGAPRLYLLVLLALTTGARRGELLGLRWGDIDLARAEARVRQTKNGDPRVLPLVPAAVDELRRLEGAPRALVFPSRRDPSRPFCYVAHYRAALREAGIRGATFHTLRHSAASMLARNGATLLEIADVLGHRQLQMTKRYSHLTTGHKAALVNRVMGDIR